MKVTLTNQEILALAEVMESSSTQLSKGILSSLATQVYWARDKILEEAEEEPYEPVSLVALAGYFRTHDLSGIAEVYRPSTVRERVITTMKHSFPLEWMLIQLIEVHKFKVSEIESTIGANKGRLVPHADRAYRIIEKLLWSIEEKAVDSVVFWQAILQRSGVAQKKMSTKGISHKRQYLINLISNKFMLLD